MTEWIPGRYAGIEYLGGPSEDANNYRGYVVEVDEYGNWFAYRYDRDSETHSWVAEGRKDEVKSILARVTA